MTYDLYNSLTIQLEQTRISERQDLPTYKILKSADPGVRNDSRNTLKIILFMSLMGFAAGIFLYYAVEMLRGKHMFKHRL